MFVTQWVFDSVRLVTCCCSKRFQCESRSSAYFRLCISLQKRWRQSSRSHEEKKEEHGWVVILLERNGFCRPPMHPAGQRWAQRQCQIKHLILLVELQLLSCRFVISHSRLEKLSHDVSHTFCSRLTIDSCSSSLQMRYVSECRNGVTCSSRSSTSHIASSLDPARSDSCCPSTMQKPLR